MSGNKVDWTNVLLELPYVVGNATWLALLYWLIDVLSGSNTDMVWSYWNSMVLALIYVECCKRNRHAKDKDD